MKVLGIRFDAAAWYVGGLLLMILLGALAGTFLGHAFLACVLIALLVLELVLVPVYNLWARRPFLEWLLAAIPTFIVVAFIGALVTFSGFFSL